MNIWNKELFSGKKDNKDDKVDETKIIEELTDISKASTKKSPSQSSDEKKPKMEEIYSTTEKNIRYKKQMPIEAEAALKKKESTKAGLRKGEVEIQFEKPGEIDEVELKAEIAEGAKVSEDIIEDVGELQNLGTIKGPSVEEAVSDEVKSGITSSSIIENNKVLPAYSSADKIVNTVPAYIHESKENKIQVKAGKFTNVVESEYDQYILYSKSVIAKTKVGNIEVPKNKSLLYHLSQFANKYKGEAKIEREKRKTTENTEEIKIKEEKEPPKKNIGRFFKVLFATIGSTFISKKGKVSQDTGPIDYEERQDEKYVLLQIKQNTRTVAYKILGLCVVAIMLLVLSIYESVYRGGVFSTISETGGPVIYVALNLYMLIVAGIVASTELIEGLKSLKKIKGNGYAAISVAYIACLIQCIVALFNAKDFAGGEHHIYAFLLVFAMVLYEVGRLLIELRIKYNFKFITSKFPAYAARIYGDETVAARMLNGTSSSRPYIAYQNETSFMTDFLKISYAPDPSEEMAGRFAPVVVISSLFVGIVYLCISHSFVSAVSSLAVVACIGVPFASMLLGNLAFLIFSKKSLKEGAMVAGFPSIRQFCDTSAVFVDACQLYPKGCVKLREIKPYIEIGLQDTLFSAAAVLKEVKSPLYHIFNDVVENSMESIPKVESAIYEEKCGVVGWTNGVRILIGNSELLARYNVDVSAISKDIHLSKDVTYIASAGQIVAEIKVDYSPSERIEKQLINAEDNGICLLVSSTDANITAKRITDDYSLYKKTVKILPLGYANESRECTSKVKDTSRAYVATRGKFLSFIKTISGCVKLKSNLTIGLIIQIVGVILGILLCATMSLYAGVTRLTVFNLLLYVVFWIVATVIAPLIRRP